MATTMASMNVTGATQALDVAFTSCQLERTSACCRIRGLPWNVAMQNSSVALRSPPARSTIVVLVRSQAQEEAGGSVNTTSSELRKGVGKDMKERTNWNRAQLAYVIVHVSDVNKAAEFYHKAFGLEIRPQNKSNSWVEMETGATTLAFTPVKQHETELSGGMSSSGNNKIVINLDFEDVDAAYEHAIAQGATSVADPEEKSWPQKVGYVKDMDGNVVRLGSFPDM